MIFKQIFEKEKDNFLQSRNKSYYIYKYTSIFVLVFLFFRIFVGDYINIYKIAFLAANFFFIAILIDLYYFIKLFWGTFYSRVIYGIFGYFAYIKATVHAKNIIYINTSVNPDVFESAVNFLAGFLLIPSWIEQLNFLLTTLGILLFLVVFIFGIFKDFFDEKYKNHYLRNYIGKNPFLHLIFFLSALGVFNYYVQIIPTKIIEFSTSDLIKEKIKENSYYLNNHLICNNKKIIWNDYIKIIGDNIVSIARVNNENKIEFYIDTCNN